MPTFVADEIVTAAKLNAATARDWTDWTPTLANMTLGSGTVEARYVQVGKLVHAKFLFTFGTGSAMGTGPTITLPVTAAAEFANDETPAGTTICNDANGSRYLGPAMLTSTTVCGLFVAAAGATHLLTGSISSTAPMTWATGDTLGADFTYEGA